MRKGLCFLGMAVASFLFIGHVRADDNFKTPISAFSSSFFVAKPLEILPALIWNPKHIESGDSLYFSLMRAGFEAIQTDSLTLFADSIDNYFLFVMGGGIHYPYVGIYWDDFEPYRLLVDSFLINGGKAYWEGVRSLSNCRDGLYSTDTILALSFNAYYTSDTLKNVSFFRGAIGSNFDDIDSLTYEPNRIADIMPNPLKALCIDQVDSSCLAGAVMTEWHSTRTITANFDWSKLRDTGTSTKQNLIIDIMNWLSGSQEQIEEKMIPSSFSLSQNYPNPFNAQTTITYSLPKSSEVSIDIYDILGRKIESLISERQRAGEHSIIWDAKDNSSGIYFYKIKADDFVDTKRCLLLK